MKKLVKALIPKKYMPFISFIYLHLKFIIFGFIEKAFPIKQIIPLPPPKLRFRVHGDILKDGFLAVGKKCFTDICSALESVDCSIEQFQSILDWGCGCGRVLRYLMQTGSAAQICGCDIDTELIRWCTRNLPKGEYAVVSPQPPLPYRSEQFDFIYGISVLTHLDEKAQFLWLRELKRVIKSGGVIILTVHGRNVYEQLSQRKKAILTDSGFMFEIGQTGKLKLDGLPDFYQTAFHTKEYIARTWSPEFTLLALIEKGMNNHQDVVVLRKKM